MKKTTGTITYPIAESLDQNIAGSGRELSLLRSSPNAQKVEQAAAPAYHFSTIEPVPLLKIRKTRKTLPTTAVKDSKANQLNWKSKTPAGRALIY